MCLVFFFQAEDGIRDHCVTGVQTCALPICHTGHAIGRREHRERAPRSSVAAHARSEERRVGKSVDLGGRRIIKKKKHTPPTQPPPPPQTPPPPPPPPTPPPPPPPPTPPPPPPPPPPSYPPPTPPPPPRAH